MNKSKYLSSSNTPVSILPGDTCTGISYNSVRANCRDDNIIPLHLPHGFLLYFLSQTIALLKYDPAHSRMQMQNINFAVN